LLATARLANPLQAAEIGHPGEEHWSLADVTLVIAEFLHLLALTGILGDHHTVHLQIRRGGGALPGADNGFDQLARDRIRLVMPHRTVVMDQFNGGIHGFQSSFL
jgi:hypothetical protein